MTNFENRLLQKRLISDTHWLWTGTIHENGYGKVCINYKQYWVHRLSAHVYLGLSLGDRTQQANHQRSCLYRVCFNPDHLYVGSALENVHDMLAMGTHYSPYKGITHCIHGHEFDVVNTKFYLDSKGYTHRDCRECNRIKDRQYYTANKGLVS